MTETIDISRWLDDPQLQLLFTTLQEIGETRFIGGAVRDALLDIDHNDLDLATTALPNTVLQHTKTAGFKMVPTGLKHGTVTAILARGAVEITTLRQDVQTDGRHATVAFTDDWQQDAARRDFTINALSVDDAGMIHDYYGGVADLAARCVRFIGDPTERIREDYLRIFRFFRFTARYGGPRLDSAALAAVQTNIQGISQLSGERIQSEILKLLTERRAPELWRIMLDTGVVDAFVIQARRIEPLERLVELDIKLGLVDPFRRFMALLPLMLSAEIDGIAERLKLSGDQKKRIIHAAVYAGRLIQVERGEYARALYGVGIEAILDAALLSAANNSLGKKPLRTLLEFTRTWQEPKFPLGGDSLMALGMKPGPIFGSLLREVELWWVDRNFEPTRQQCFAELKNAWQERKKSAQ